MPISERLTHGGTRNGLVMNIQLVAPNMVMAIKDNGTIVLVSYATPVAAFHDGTWYATNERYSNMTTRHVKRFIDGRKCELCDPSFFQGLLDS